MTARMRVKDEGEGENDNKSAKPEPYQAAPQRGAEVGNSFTSRLVFIIVLEQCVGVCEYKYVCVFDCGGCECVCMCISMCMCMRIPDYLYLCMRILDYLRLRLRLSLCLIVYAYANDTEVAQCIRTRPSHKPIGLQCKHKQQIQNPISKHKNHPRIRSYSLNASWLSSACSSVSLSSLTSSVR